MLFATDALHKEGIQTRLAIYTKCSAYLRVR
jgi:hypothetical protein